MNRYNILLLAVYFFSILGVYFFITYEKEQKTRDFKLQHFSTIAQKTQHDIKTLIEEKQHATLAMVISLAQSDIYLNALKQNNSQLIDLKKLSSYFKKNTAFKNVWLQITDKNGASFKRSWTDKVGDKLLNIREDLRYIHKEKEIKSTISVGKFSITFKSMVPMFEGDEFLGVFEIITHFNSIDRKLQDDAITSIVLADKKFKDQLTQSLTQEFIDDYYVANLDFNPTIVKTLKDKGIEKFINSNRLFHEYNQKYILTVFNIKNDFNENIGYYLALIPKNIDIAKLNGIITTMNLYGFIAFITLSILLYILLDKQNIVSQLTDKAKKTKLISTLIFIFIIFEILLYLLLFTEKENKINQFLRQTTTHNQTIYNQSYFKYKDFANVIFETSVNTDKVKEILLQIPHDKTVARRNLYTYLKDDYGILKKYNLKQLHFHLPNNESFLRFHRPDKFGDDLTGFRETVQWVNSTKEPIDGFEEGRIYNGYRFVYPLFKGEHYLGSVEVSFSVRSMMEEFLKNFNYKSDFYIRKSVVDKRLMKDEHDNYIKSELSDFYQEKSLKDFVLNNYNSIGLCLESEKTLQNINDKILQSKPFSMHLCDYKNVVTFLPMLNPITKDIVGAFVISKDENYIKNKTLNTMVNFSVLSMFMMFLLIFIYRELIAKTGLKLLNKNLENLVRQEVEKNRQKDQIMTQQAKLAAMGEMIGAIAHQWRQPLNSLNINIQNLDDDYEEGLINQKFINDFIQKQSKTIQFMSKTIDDFRNFFRIDKEKTKFSLKQTVENTAYIFDTQLTSHNIKLNINCDDTLLLGYKSEFQQMLLNLISNAKDAMIENNVKNAKIEIYNDKKKLYIKDNGGGIDASLKDKIFDAYFTTKDEGKGTGMGLYMSKMIIEKNMGEKLEVYNDTHGAVFTITLTHSKVAQ